MNPAFSFSLRRHRQNRAEKTGEREWSGRLLAARSGGGDGSGGAPDLAELGDGVAEAVDLGVGGDGGGGHRDPGGEERRARCFGGRGGEDGSRCQMTGRERWLCEAMRLRFLIGVAPRSPSPHRRDARRNVPLR